VAVKVNDPSPVNLPKSLGVVKTLIYIFELEIIKAPSGIWFKETHL